ncbi:hypothetical protein [Dinghuibacter silviterrae]|uniref:CHAT domain-containing protein n=1 Tax=Dinghuibacter silviterrae TaxID=1539049 RepID=A0A4R8DPV6_9BACT|nr:hypothetical protein [Dinghuibacter silviterrae]TDX00132.1 hypothetical protein EDB95_1149 [Dinghuibacter silviterrae]
MKGLYIAALMISVSFCAYAHGQNDTTKIRIPLNRQIFHDRIDDEQVKADLMDGKRDTLLHISPSPAINKQASDAIFKQVDWLQWRIEADMRIPGTNEKIKYLRDLEDLVKDFQNRWREHKFSPELTAALVRDFQKVMDMDIKGGSIEDLIQEMPYDVGAILVDIFNDNPGAKAAGKVLFLKYCGLHTSYILPNILPYKDEPFADSLIAVVAVKRPQELYSYAQALGSPTANLIRRNEDPKVKVIVQMSDTKDGQLLFPFIDDLLSGKQTTDDIGKTLGNDVLYYKLLVKTEIDYARRLPLRDTPMGMHNLTDMLQTKALSVFVNTINELHESPDPVRFKCLQPLTPEELYYLMVLGEEDIFTSSYVYCYKKMMEKIPSHKGDSLLLNVWFDKFKKFIKMAASYNTLGDFLRSMDDGHAMPLMAAFARGLDRTADNSLEDAVDVADSYASINDPNLRDFLLNEVNTNYDRCLAEHNKRGEVIYYLLKTIFAAADSNSHIDLTKEVGIPPIYRVDHKSLVDDSGRVVEQVFFYGDKDGLQSYADFMSLFSPKEWRISRTKEWITIKSIHGKPVWIFANLPLDNISDQDAAAQKDLCDYLDKENLHPTVVIHRGHSYHVKYTIPQIAPSARIIILGSCGGYKNLHDVLEVCPDAHIISSKQTGTQTVNEPIIKALNSELLAGKDVEWIALWNALAREFKGNAQAMDRFSDYIPPHKNLGALFIKAYKIKMGTDEEN